MDNFNLPIISNSARVLRAGGRGDSVPPAGGACDSSRVAAQPSTVATATLPPRGAHRGHDGHAAGRLRQQVSHCVGLTEGMTRMLQVNFSNRSATAQVL